MSTTKSEHDHQGSLPEQAGVDELFAEPEVTTPGREPRRLQSQGSSTPQVGEGKAAGAKKPKRSRLRVSFLDEVNWADDGVISETQWPKRIYIGYIANIQKKHLINYINEWIADNECNKSSCKYQIVKWKDGYAYEVQEGGCGLGVLQSVLKNIVEVDELIVPSSDRFVRISRRADSFTSYLLNEFEQAEPSECLIFKDELTTVYKRNFGLMLSGIIFGMLGIVVLLVAWVLVFMIYNKDQVASWRKSTVEPPSFQITKLEDVSLRSDVYVTSIKFENGSWKINTGRVGSSIQPQQPMQNAMRDRLDREGLEYLRQSEPKHPDTASLPTQPRLKQDNTIKETRK